MPDAISIRGVTKTFGTKVAVRDLDLVVPEGKLYGFIGPNGAGKTTTIRMIMSIIFADKGEIGVLGRRSALESKDKIGYLPEERGVYRKMRVGAFLKYIARLKSAGGPGLEARVKDWLDRVGLADCWKKRCEELSKGMQQKVQFLAAIIHDPRLLILDEPFSGLDPVNMRLLRDLIAEQHRSGKTVIFSTHVMPQAEQLCDHIVMIHQGRKVLDDSLSGIRASHDPRTVVFEPMEAGADVSGVERLPGVESVALVDGRYEASIQPGTDPGALIRSIAAAVPARKIEVHQPTLEDVFIEIVQGTRAAPDRESARQLLHQGEAAADGAGVGVQR